MIERRSKLSTPIKSPQVTVRQPLSPPLGNGAAIRHPGQVRPRRTRAGIQTTSPRRRGTRHQMTLLNFHWIPDIRPRRIPE
jgi:hypothetical protein